MNNISFVRLCGNNTHELGRKTRKLKDSCVIFHFLVNGPFRSDRADVDDVLKLLIAFFPNFS